MSPIASLKASFVRFRQKAKRLRFFLLGTGEDLYDRDFRQLRTLAGSFFLFGLLGNLMTCISIPNMIVVLSFLILPAKEGGGFEFTEQVVIWMSATFFAALVAFVLIERTCFFTCQSISQRRSYRFVILISRIVCLFFPIGTILGLCALRVMRRESVRELFGVADMK